MPKLRGSPLPSGPVGFLDIETTGLWAVRDQVTVVGIGHGTRRGRVLEQFFVEEPDDEPEVISVVVQRLQRFAGVLVYNGVGFDLPFLRARAKRHRIRFPWVEAWDLLYVAREWRYTYGEPESCTLQNVMGHFGIRRNDHANGADIAEAYFDWLESGDAASRDLILDHNAEDVLLLPDLVPCLSRAPRRNRRLSERQLPAT